jgi:hypothetical protein
LVIKVTIPRFKNRHTRLIVTALLTLLLVSAILLVLNPFTSNPVPDNIRPKVHFSVIYPGSRGVSVKQDSWGFSDEQQSLSYNVKSGNLSAVVTEEKVPLAFRDDEASYNRFIGSLRPSLNFNCPLGSVSVANFVSGFGSSFTPEGPSGIMKTHGTLVLVHPLGRVTVSDSDWQTLFDSLQVSS